MNKNLSIGIAAVAVVVLIVAGAWYMMSGKENDTKTNTETTGTTDTGSASGIVQSGDESGSTSDVSVDSALTKLQNAGMTVGPDQGVIGGMVMASGSAKVDVDGKVVEIYSYENADNQAKGLESLLTMAQSMEEAKASGQMGDIDVATEIFEHENLIVVVHSGDQAFVDSVKNAIKS